MDKKYILTKCKASGFLLDKEMFKFFSDLDRKSFDFILENINIFRIKEKILTKEIFDKQKDKINHLFYNKCQKNIKILSKLKKNNKKTTDIDFIDFFCQRFNIIHEIFLSKNIKNLTSIRRLSHCNGNYDIIGMIYNKRITKNKNLLLEIEDLGGKTLILVNRENYKLFKRVEKLVVDDILCFNCSGSSKMLFLNDFIFPGFSNKAEKFGNIDNNIAFISDLHVGSKLFLEKDLQRFISWVNGEIGSSRSKKIAKKLKYIVIVGDLVEGVGIFAGQDKFLNIQSYREQYEKLFNLLSEIRKDVEILICPGLHDAVWDGEVQSNIAKKWINIDYFGPNFKKITNPSLVEIAGLKIFINYGINSKRFLGKFGKNIGIEGIDEILKRRSLPIVYSESDFIPEDFNNFVIPEDLDIFVSGGRHRCEIGYYKNILKISTSCWCDKSDFEIRNGFEVDCCRVPVLNLKSKEVKELDFSEKEILLDNKSVLR